MNHPFQGRKQKYQTIETNKILRYDTTTNVFTEIDSLCQPKKISGGVVYTDNFDGRKGFLFAGGWSETENEQVGCVEFFDVAKNVSMILFGRNTLL